MWQRRRNIPNNAVQCTGNETKSHLVINKECSNSLTSDNIILLQLNAHGTLFRVKLVFPGKVLHIGHNPPKDFCFRIFIFKKVLFLPIKIVAKSVYLELFFGSIQKQPLWFLLSDPLSAARHTRFPSSSHSTKSSFTASCFLPMVLAMLLYHFCPWVHPPG